MYLVFAIDFLKIYKIFAKRDKKNIGIWVNNKKIAAIGLRVSKWVAFHGCSINLNNNLKEYQKIVPCGLDNQKITSAYKEKGIKIKNMENILSENNIKPIDAVGEIFDPQIHEAVSMVVDETLDEGTITQEVSKGYISGKAILKPSKVIVSKK